ncbi:MAG: hypothetical protein KDA24_11215 [Deltaproteobacteria bacterium]|nr:hypothetical protein [Deltaproteobacteria bacterium]
MSTAPRRPIAPALLALAAVLWTAWLHYTTWVGLQNGLIDRGILELLQHETPPFGTWSGRVHPPLYSVVLWAADSLSVPLATAPERLLFVQGGLSHVAVVLLVLGAAWRWLGPWPAAAAAWLLSFGTESMRPFEHYPISAVAATAAAVALLALARGGGRRAIAITAGLGFLAFMLHLQPWFFFGPLLVGLWWWLPSRRVALQWAGGAVFLAFMATTWPGLYRQLVDSGGGGGEPGTWTFGWMNGWLYLPLIFWPFLGRRGTESWRGLGVGLVGYALVTFALQLTQIADGQPYPSSLHYFALVEPLACLAAIAALTLAWRGGGRLRVAGVLVAAVMTATQLWRWVDGMTWLWRQQSGMWHQALQPWNWW